MLPARSKAASLLIILCTLEVILSLIRARRIRRAAQLRNLKLYFKSPQAKLCPLCLPQLLRSRALLNITASVTLIFFPYVARKDKIQML